MSYSTAALESISKTFSNSPYTSTFIMVLGAASNSNLSCKSPVCLGLSLTVSTSIGYIVKHEQSTILCLSPISSFHHVALFFCARLHSREENESTQNYLGLHCREPTVGFHKGILLLSQSVEWNAVQISESRRDLGSHLH